MKPSLVDPIYVHREIELPINQKSDGLLTSNLLFIQVQRVDGGVLGAILGDISATFPKPTQPPAATSTTAEDQVPEGDTRTSTEANAAAEDEVFDQAPGNAAETAVEEPDADMVEEQKVNKKK